MIDRRVQRWIEGYLEAWRSNDPAAIRAIFSDDARYFTAPHREPWEGADAIVKGWLDRRDQPGEWNFRWEQLAVNDDLAFVRGWTEYPKEGKRYANLWVIRLAEDGRAREFTEWWMEA